MDANMHLKAASAIAYVKGGKYTVWSIHTYTKHPVEDGVYGEIMANGGDPALGLVYFKTDQWVCSYGMKYMLSDCEIRLSFKTANSPMTLYITDYQIVQFDDLASANSFVNSREFAKYSQDHGQRKKQIGSSEFVNSETTPIIDSTVIIDRT